MHHRFSRTLLGVFALAAVATSGCDTSTGASPERKTLIDSRDTEDPRSLDPALSTDVPTGRAVGYIFDGLTGFTADAKLEPRLAERWDVSPDGLTYTFHLRHGVTFHKGAKFTSADVLRSFLRVLDPKTKGGRGWPLYPIIGAKLPFRLSASAMIRQLQIIADVTITLPPA